MCIVRTERRVNGKRHSVWLRIPTGLKGLPQNRELNFFQNFPYLWLN